MRTSKPSINRGPRFAGLLLFLLLSATVARAEAPPCPHWCEDLGIDCTVFDKANHQYGRMRSHPILDSLNAQPPTKFLPPDLAQYVERCEYARKQGNEFSLKRLHAEANPLRGALNGLLLVPKEHEAMAELPRSGARIVADCKGVHLQLKASPMSLLKKNMQAAIDGAKLLKGLNRFSSSGPRVTAVSCTFAELARKEVQFSTWQITPNSKLEIAAIPSWMVAPSCFTTGKEKPKPHPFDIPPAKKVLVSNLKDYRNSLLDIRDEVRFLNDYCEYTTGETNTGKKKFDQCIKDNRDGLNALSADFQSRLSRTQLREYELQLASTASDGTTRAKHLARALFVKGMELGIKMGEQTVPAIRDEYAENRAWCEAHACDCATSGVLQSLLMTTAWFPENSTMSKSLFAHVKTSGCDMKMDLLSVVYTSDFFADTTED